MNTTDWASIDDLFSLKSPDSLTRRQFREPIRIQKDTQLPLFQPDGSYVAETITITPEQNTLDYNGKLAEICKRGAHTGKHERFSNAVYEAFRNAHQHGNKKDPSKTITVHHRSTETTFEVVVSDQGGTLRPDFPAYIAFIRQRPCGILSYYTFAPGTPRDTNENAGIGTFNIHLTSDRVEYYRNEHGGLSVKMTIEKS
ncbi:ATP-binding protein [Candidatus Woesearchaeota archaeon]|nr:ATP-binding protein [Candidatus Woesearchaeota archaeon]